MYKVQFDTFLVPIRTVMVEERVWYGRRLLYQGHAHGCHQKYCLPTATQPTTTKPVILRFQGISNLNEVLICGFHS